MRTLVYALILTIPLFPSSPLVTLAAASAAFDPYVSEYADVIRTFQNTSPALEGFEFFGLNNLDLGSYPLNLDDPALTSATRMYGESVINMNALPIRSGPIDTGVRPWSSWWYPKNEDKLFRDDPAISEHPNSTLGKYDLFRKLQWEKERDSNGPAPISAADYENAHYRANSFSWEGLCDAWALASILYPEPKTSISKAYNTGLFSTTHIEFNTDDLKALILKTYEGISSAGLTYHGQKFTGDADGWVFPDIFPDQFHRFIEASFAAKKMPFVMDHDPGIEIWNVPVYKVNYLIDRVPNQSNSVFVKMWVYSASSTAANEKNFLGSKEVIREYDYILAGTLQADGKLLVNSGFWVKMPNGGVDSRRDHPDFVIELTDPSAITRKSHNPGIDPKEVDELIKNNPSNRT